MARFAGPEDVSVSRDRHWGFVDALEDNAVPLEHDTAIRGGSEENDGVVAFESLAGELPDAIFALNELVAFGAYTKIKERGLRIPEGIALKEKLL